MKNYENLNVLMISHDAIIMPFICYLNNVKHIDKKDIVGYLEGRLISFP